MTSAVYLGFDLSTQQLKCLAIDETLTIVASATVVFDKDFPAYGTNKGVYVKEGGVVDAPVSMWLDAIDLCFQRLSAKVDMQRVASMSGSCQQHGSIYWNIETLPQLDYTRTLSEQVSPLLARNTAPNWQDHSTAKQCERFAAELGGAAELASHTGSTAHHRFTGPQIAKIHEQEPQIYECTSTISLVSSFLASIMTGTLVQLEEADACGMNLYDIPNRVYNDRLMSLVDSDVRRLSKKLRGLPIKCEEQKSLGLISHYFVKKFNVNPKCQVYPFTGDNLATICSLPLQKNDVLVSLGTSTTILLVTDQYEPSPDYHMFMHPTVPDHYMGMICYCNGALAREKVRDNLPIIGDDDEKEEGGKGQDPEKAWTQFDTALADKNICTDNQIAIYFPLAEIVPSTGAVTKRCTFSLQDPQHVVLETVDNFEDARQDVKNIVESQALSCRVRISPLLTGTVNSPALAHDWMVSFDHNERALSSFARRPHRAFFVGGASSNRNIVETMAHVIGATSGNYTLETPNSCALGGCYRALWSEQTRTGHVNERFDIWLNRNFHWERDCEFVCESDSAKWEKFNGKIAALSALENSL